MRSLQRLTALILTILTSLVHPAQPASAQIVDGGCLFFEQTRQRICGDFLEYWQMNGGLPVFGFPITSATTRSTADGKFMTQYFQRDRLEYHPEIGPHTILAGRLGAEMHGIQPAAPQKTDACHYFVETGHNSCDPYLDYWELNGGLERFGYPIGEPYFDRARGLTVQYFERRRMEWHPDHGILLGLLGCEYLTRGGAPAPTGC